MANYAVQKAKYGGMVGTIHPFTCQLPAGNDPNAGNYRSKLPAGFLRCDGSIFKQRDYPQLAAVLGVGDSCKFAKGELEDDEFQLPDIGSKYIVPGSATGTYLSENLSDGNTPHVGAEFEVTSNRGESAEVKYSGNFTITGRTGDVLGNPFYAAPENSFTGIITSSHFQGHGHSSNAQVLNCTGNYFVSPAVGPSGDDSHSGNNCRPFAGNNLFNLATPDGTSAISAQHDHLITMPVSQNDYDHNFKYTYATTQVPANNLKTTVNITTQDVDTFDETVAPFLIVEYIIKY